MTASTHKEYRELVEKLVRNNSATRISNGQSAHAAILIETMFKNACSEVRIYSGELNNDVYCGDGVIHSAIEFLKKAGSSLRILLQKDHESSSHKLLNAIESNDDLLGDYEVRVAVGTYATDDADHFAIMDEKGFRYEIDHDKCNAIASFNEPETAQKMATIFDFVFDHQSVEPQHFKAKTI